jgi:Tfp pilus assembly protein PilX
MKSSSRTRSAEERGFALISALVISFLFFAVIGLILIESTLSLRSAHRFRAKVVAQNLAESGMQLALQELAMGDDGRIDYSAAEGKITSTCETRVLPSMQTEFELNVTGSSADVQPSVSKIKAIGIVDGGTVTVQQLEHSQ